MDDVPTARTLGEHRRAVVGFVFDQQSAFGDPALATGTLTERGVGTHGRFSIGWAAVAIDRPMLFPGSPRTPLKLSHAR